MKKLICLLMVIVLAACATIPMISAESILNNDSDSAQSSISYNVASSYEVIIPEWINANEGYVFTASSMNLREDEELQIYVEDYNALHVENQNGVQMGITINADNDGLVGTFRNGDTNSRMGMTVDADTYGKPAGDYTGTVSFTLALTLYN